VACPDCPSISFPLSAPSREAMVKKGYQTAAGFTLVEETEVIADVEPGSAAWKAGLRPKDKIIKINGEEVVGRRTVLSNGKEVEVRDLDWRFVGGWPRGKNDLVLTVYRDGKTMDLGPFTPWTIGLHPTQLYESISMALLFALLMAYYPFRRHDGEVMVLFMIGYAVHRFLDEILR